MAKPFVNLLTQKQKEKKDMQFAIDKLSQLTGQYNAAKDRLRIKPQLTNSNYSREDMMIDMQKMQDACEKLKLFTLPSHVVKQAESMDPDKAILNSQYKDYIKIRGSDKEQQTFFTNLMMQHDVPMPIAKTHVELLNEIVSSIEEEKSKKVSLWDKVKNVVSDFMNLKQNTKLPNKAHPVEYEDSKNTANVVQGQPIPGQNIQDSADNPVWVKQKCSENLHRTGFYDHHQDHAHSNPSNKKSMDPNNNHDDDESEGESEGRSKGYSN